MLVLLHLEDECKFPIQNLEGQQAARSQNGHCFAFSLIYVRSSPKFQLLRTPSMLDVNSLSVTLSLEFGQIDIIGGEILLIAIANRVLK